MKSAEVVITPLPYTTRIDRHGDFRISSHTALVTDATVTLYNQTPGARIFIPGESTFGPDYPTTASLMKAQLVKKGVPEEVIGTQDNLNDTESQLRAIKDKGIQDPTIVNMEFHDDRVNTLRKQLQLEGTTIVAENIVLRTHSRATSERLKKFAATKTKILGISKVMLAETIGKNGARLGKIGKTAVNVVRKGLKVYGATVTDYHYVGSAQKHFEEAMKDPAKRERILAQKKKMPPRETRSFAGFDLTALTPENPISETPVLVLPGFGSDAEVYELFIQQLLSDGFSVVYPTYKFGNKGEPKEFFFFPHVDKLKQNAIVATAATYGYPNEQGEKQINIVAHSKAAIDVVDTAKKHAKSFKNVILVAPGGLHNMHAVQYVWVMKEGRKKDDEDKEKLYERGGDLVRILDLNKKHSYGYRGWRYAREGLTSCVRTIHGSLRGLREKGVKIVVVGHTEDSLFVPGQYQPAIIDKTAVPLITPDSVDGFVSLRGIHGDIKFNSKVCKAISDILQTLEQPRSTTS